MIVYAQAEAVLQDDLVKARGGSNASAARSWNKNQEVERYFRIWKQMRPLEDFQARNKLLQIAKVASTDNMFDVMKECDVVFTATGSQARQTMTSCINICGRQVETFVIARIAYSTGCQVPSFLSANSLNCAQESLKSFQPDDSI